MAMAVAVLVGLEDRIAGAGSGTVPPSVPVVSATPPSTTATARAPPSVRRPVRRRRSRSPRRRTSSAGSMGPAWPSASRERVSRGSGTTDTFRESVGGSLAEQHEQGGATAGQARLDGALGGADLGGHLV